MRRFITPGAITQFASLTPGYYFKDLFARSDSTLPGKADIGGEWKQNKHGYACCGILSNKLYFGAAAAANWSGISIDSGKTDGIIRFNWWGNGAGNLLNLIAFRFVDTSNYAYLTVQTYNGNQTYYYLAKVVAGVTTSSNHLDNLNWVSGDEIKLSFIGDAVEVFLNGVSKHTFNLGGSLTSGTIQEVLIYNNVAHDGAISNLSFRDS